MQNLLELAEALDDIDLGLRDDADTEGNREQRNDEDQQDQYAGGIHFPSTDGEQSRDLYRDRAGLATVSYFGRSASVLVDFRA